MTEKVLALIASILNVFGIASTGIVLYSVENLFKSDAFQRQMTEDIQNDVDALFTAKELQMIFDFVGSVGWFVIVVLVISLILGTAGMIKLHSDTRLAGILFIGAGIFACLISISSIFYYIAAFLCFNKKKNQPQEAPVSKNNRQHYSRSHEQSKP